jgi:NAD(P)-dependent dehydrogenase (short-subunit alcohol dehydrogenase family)
LSSDGSVKTYSVDGSKTEEVLAHAEPVQRTCGAAHYIANNAEVTLVGTIEHTTLEEIAWQMGINLWGVIYGTKAFLSMMQEQKQGDIVIMPTFKCSR